MKPRKHHYFPRMLLKRFCAPNGLLWVNNGIKVYRSNPKDAFEERDLYATRNVVPSSVGNDYSVNLSYEHEQTLSKIENAADPAIRQILDQARQRSCPKLSPDLQNAWKDFYIAMARRTPEAQEKIWSENDLKDAFYEGSKRVAEKDEVPLPEKEVLFQSDNIAGLAKLGGQNSKARFSAGSHPILQEDAKRFVRSAGLLVALIPFSEKSFVIGSHGLAIVEGSDHGDWIEGCCWLPVAPDVAICPIGFPNTEHFVCFGNDRDGNLRIDMVNNASAARSWLIGGQSEELVRSVQPARRKS